MGRNEDVIARDVTKLIAIAEKIAKHYSIDCGECLRSRSHKSRAAGVAGCPYCAARQVVASIQVRKLRRLRELRLKREFLRGVGRRVRQQKDAPTPDSDGRAGDRGGD